MASVWISAIIFFAAQGGCCNLIPSYVGTRFGRWDYSAAYRVIGAITHLFAGIGVMCTRLFPNYTAMYLFDIVMIIIGFAILLKSDDSFIGKPG